MWSAAPTVADRDVVILWLTRDLIQPLVVTPGKEFNSKFGVYRHQDLVGIPYGSKIRSRNGKGFIHVLRPTPELWTLALPHRTQILYLADIAFIISWLNIKPGSRVIEAGTGSGSFSHSVARTIGSSGHLWSYEFHETRVNKAREEFSRHGMDAFVTLTHRNVCKDGFTVTGAADAVFLDLPAPWEAAAHARQALRKDRTTRICCFSPCMEQVLRTVSALNDAGFTEITMYETLLRPHQVDAGAPLAPVGEVSARLKQAEARREEKRLRQIANSRAARGAAGKRKREAAEAEAADVMGKKPKTDDEDGPLVVAEADVEAAAAGGEAGETAGAAGCQPADPVSAPPARSSVSKAFPEVRGHTSYLTFACLLPAVHTGAEAAATASASGSAETAPGVEAEARSTNTVITP